MCFPRQLLSMHSVKARLHCICDICVHCKCDILQNVAVVTARLTVMYCRHNLPLLQPHSDKRLHLVLFCYYSFMESFNVQIAFNRVPTNSWAVLPLLL